MEMLKDPAEPTVAEACDYFRVVLANLYLKLTEVTDEEHSLAYQVYHVAHCKDNSYEDFRPMFECSIESVQSLYYKMWEAMKSHTKDLAEDNVTLSVRCLLTLLWLRRKEWSKEYTNHRIKEMRYNLEKIIYMNGRTITKLDGVDEVWYHTRLIQFKHEERKVLEAHLQDVWTWENGGPANRQLWTVCENYVKNVRHWEHYDTLERFYEHHLTL